jgi:methionine-R-sulfoxide reductase
VKILLKYKALFSVTAAFVVTFLWFFYRTPLSNNTVTMENTNIPTQGSWKNFTPEQKAQRLKSLTPLQVNVTQHEGTEPPYANEYYNNKEKGIYVDIVSGEPLFLSTDKYDSGTGWPSFVKPIDQSHITLHKDDGLFTPRIEVKSSIASSHLGHVFDDGPTDRGGKRYCMDSASLQFIPLNDMEKEGYGEFVAQIK